MGAPHTSDMAARLFAMGQAARVDARHDVLQHLLQLALAPASPRAVLAHLQTRHRDAAGIGRLARRIHQLRGAEDVDAGEIGRHVRALADRDAARSEEHTSELQSLMRSSYAVFCL